MHQKGTHILLQSPFFRSFSLYIPGMQDYIEHTKSHNYTAMKVIIY